MAKDYARCQCPEASEFLDLLLALFRCLAAAVLGTCCSAKVARKSTDVRLVSLINRRLFGFFSLS